MIDSFLRTMVEQPKLDTMGRGYPLHVQTEEWNGKRIWSEGSDVNADQLVDDQMLVGASKSNLFNRWYMAHKVKTYFTTFNGTNFSAGFQYDKLLPIMEERLFCNVSSSCLEFFL